MSVRSFIAVALVVVTLVGCAQPSSPTSPASSIDRPSTAVPTSSVVVPGSATDTLMPTAVSGRPEYELAYYNGAIVMMNHISVPQNPGALAHAAADLYAVFY